MCTSLRGAVSRKGALWKAGLSSNGVTLHVRKEAERVFLVGLDGVHRAVPGCRSGVSLPNSECKPGSLDFIAGEWWIALPSHADRSPAEDLLTHTPKRCGEGCCSRAARGVKNETLPSWGVSPWECGVVQFDVMSMYVQYTGGET